MGMGPRVEWNENNDLVSLLQLICEAYHLMKDALGMNTDEMSEVGKYCSLQVALLLYLLMS